MYHETKTRRETRTPMLRTVKSILESGAERKNEGAKMRDGGEVVLAHNAETWRAEGTGNETEVFHL
jgi:hypothetical protein